MTKLSLLKILLREGSHPSFIHRQALMNYLENREPGTGEEELTPDS